MARDEGQRRVPAGKVGACLVQRAGGDHRGEAAGDAVVQPVRVRHKNQRLGCPRGAEAAAACPPASRQGRDRWRAAPPTRAGRGRRSSGRSARRVPASSSASRPSRPSVCIRGSASARTSAGIGGISASPRVRAVKFSPVPPTITTGAVKKRCHLAQPMADRIGLVAPDVAVKRVGQGGLVRDRGPGRQDAPVFIDLQGIGVDDHAGRRGPQAPSPARIFRWRWARRSGPVPRARCCRSAWPPPVRTPVEPAAVLRHFAAQSKQKTICRGCHDRNGHQDRGCGHHIQPRHAEDLGRGADGGSGVWPAPADRCADRARGEVGARPWASRSAW